MEVNEKKSNLDLIEIEAKLLEQEHRPTHLIINYLRRTKKYPDSKDLRRKAVERAIVWRLFFSPAVIAAGGGTLLTIVTIFFMMKQNKIISNQNKLLEEQNRKIEIQTNLEEASRRHSLVLLMDDVLQEVDEKKGKLSPMLMSRIRAIGLGLRPYKFLDYSLKGKSGKDSLGLTKAFSPERGQLLLALSNGYLSTTTLNKIFIKTPFERSYLVNAELEGAYLDSINLEKANLSKANLRGVKLKGADLYGADLSGAYLNNAKLQGTYFFDAKMINTKLINAELMYTNMSGANFSNAVLINAKLHEADLDGVSLYKADLKGAEFFKVDLQGLKSLHKAKVDRLDWFAYQKDTFKAIGIEELKKKYYVKKNRSGEFRIIHKDSI